MLLTTLSMFHLAAGYLARDQVGTIFNRSTLPGPTQLRRYGLALLAIIAVTTIGFLQRIVSTVDLTFSQWSICVGIVIAWHRPLQRRSKILRNGSQPSTRGS